MPAELELGFSFKLSGFEIQIEWLVNMEFFIYLNLDSNSGVKCLHLEK